MEILVLAATEMELSGFIAERNQAELNNAGCNISLLITGVGAVNTTYALTKKLSTQHFDLAIQAGIAGSFSDDVKNGEVVLVKQDCFGDLGTEENNKFQTIFMAGFGNADEFPFTNAWLLNEHPLLTSLSLPKVKGVTVNKVSDSLLQKNQLVELLNPAVESMEGAAFHYVCLHEKIPFLQMRSISNKVGDRNKANWNFKDAIINLDCELNKLISAVTTATAK